MTIFTHKPADPAAALPTVVSLEEACTWVKVANDDSDIGRLVIAAQVRVEEFCRQPIFNRAFITTLRGFESGYFDSLLVTEIVEVEYRIKGNPSFQTLAAENYDLFENELRFEPSVFAIENVDRVKILFRAGYEKTPESIIHAMMLLIGAGYDNRADSKQAAQTQAETWLEPHVLMHL